MITSIIIILTILITLVYIIACMLGAMIFSFRVPMFFILFVLIFLALVKIYIRNKKYGSKNLLRVFQKKPIENEQLNLVEYILKKWKSVHYLYKTKDNMIIFLSKSGVYIIKVIDYYGTVEGNELEQTLILKDETTSIIDNFFLRLNKIENELKTKLFHVPIQKIIVSKETCTIGVPYKEEYLVIGIHSFYDKTKILEKKQILSIEEVQKVNQIVLEYLGEKL